MTSITDPQDTKPAAPSAGGGLGSALGMVGTGLALVALVAAAYLYLELREARRQIGALQVRVGEEAATADKRTKELDLGLAAVRGQTEAVAEKAGMTAAELERTAAAARQLRDEQRKGQESLASLGGEVGKVKDDVAASKAAIEQTQAQLQRAIGDLGEQSGLIAVGPFAYLTVVLIVQAASSAVMGVPSDQLVPGARWNVQSRPSGEVSQEVAQSPTRK